MSNVAIKDANDAVQRIDVIERNEGGVVVQTQAVAVVDPATGDVLKPAADGSLPVSIAALPGLDGEAADGVSLESGSGRLGWISSIYDLLDGIASYGLKVTPQLPADRSITYPVNVGNEHTQLNFDTRGSTDAVISIFGTINNCSLEFTAAYDDAGTAFGPIVGTALHAPNVVQSDAAGLNTAPINGAFAWRFCTIGVCFLSVAVRNPGPDTVLVKCSPVRA